MAKYLGETTFISRRGVVYVEEYATTWRVSARRHGHAFICVEGLRFKKSQFKTSDEVAQYVADKEL